MKVGWLFTTEKPTAEAPSTGDVAIRTRVSFQPLTKAIMTETRQVAKCWVAFASFSEIPSLILLTSLEMVKFEKN